MTGILSMVAPGPEERCAEAHVETFRAPRTVLMDAKTENATAGVPP
jgi:hypothetical protein